MLKIEKCFYSVCVRVRKDEVSNCKQVAYNDTKVLLSAEFPYGDDIMLSFVFDQEVSKPLFLFKTGAEEAAFPISFKMAGNPNELRQKIVEIGKCPKLSSTGVPLDKQSILVLIICESREEANRILAIASN